MDKNEDKNEDKDSLTGAVREGIEQAIDLTIDTIAQVPKGFGGVTGVIGSRFFEPQASRVGQPPGTLAFSGEKKTVEVQILVFDYSEDSIEEKKLDAIEECFEYRDTETITWINIVGLHDVELLEFQRPSRHLLRNRSILKQRFLEQIVLVANIYISSEALD